MRERVSKSHILIRVRLFYLPLYKYICISCLLDENFTRFCESWRFKSYDYFTRRISSRLHLLSPFLVSTLWAVVLVANQCFFSNTSNYFNSRMDYRDCSMNLSDFRDGQRYDMWLSLASIKMGRIHLAITVVEANGKVVFSLKVVSGARISNVIGNQMALL